MRKSMTTMMMLMTSMFGCAACSSDGASKEAADVSANDNVPTDFQIQYTGWDARLRRARHTNSPEEVAETISQLMKEGKMHR